MSCPVASLLVHTLSLNLSTPTFGVPEQGAVFYHVVSLLSRLGCYSCIRTEYLSSYPYFPNFVASSFALISVAFTPYPRGNSFNSLTVTSANSCE
jgi:hypothetical protein